MFDRPGGHAEPEKILNTNEISDDAVTNEVQFLQILVFVYFTLK